MKKKVVLAITVLTFPLGLLGWVLTPDVWTEMGPWTIWRYLVSAVFDITYPAPMRWKF